MKIASVLVVVVCLYEGINIHTNRQGEILKAMVSVKLSYGYDFPYEFHVLL